MAARRGSIQEYPDNPFNPGFGVAPPLLAGRQEILHSVLSGLGRGPGRHEFHSVIVGPRGTGKTVLLAEIERHVSLENRALVLRWSGTESLVQRIAEQQPALDAQLSGATRRGLRRVDPEVSVRAAPIGIGIEARFGGRDPRLIVHSVHSLLEQLARAAAKRHRTIVILADELQAAALDDLRQLGVSIKTSPTCSGSLSRSLVLGFPTPQQTFQRAERHISRTARAVEHRPARRRRHSRCDRDPDRQCRPTHQPHGPRRTRRGEWWVPLRDSTCRVVLLGCGGAGSGAQCSPRPNRRAQGQRRPAQRRVRHDVATRFPGRPHVPRGRGANAHVRGRVSYSRHRRAAWSSALSYNCYARPAHQPPCASVLARSRRRAVHAARVRRLGDSTAGRSCPPEGVDQADTAEVVGCLRRLAAHISTFNVLRRLAK